MSDIPMYALIATAIGLTTYFKVSKFLGGMLIMLLGIGVMYKAPADAWIGWLIMPAGFLMIVYTAFEKRKNRRR